MLLRKATAADIAGLALLVHQYWGLEHIPGTTGNPKGALFSLRSIVLNAMMICAPGMFHVILPCQTITAAVSYCPAYQTALSKSSHQPPRPFPIPSSRSTTSMRSTYFAFL
jgi:hypothetical protein